MTWAVMYLLVTHGAGNWIFSCHVLGWQLGWQMFGVFLTSVTGIVSHQIIGFSEPSRNQWQHQSQYELILIAKV